jgi:hypothetical protein
MASPGLPEFDGRGIPDSPPVFDVTTGAVLSNRTGAGRVAGLKVGIDVRSTFGSAAAQFNAKLHPNKARNDIHKTSIRTNPIITP